MPRRSRVAKQRVAELTFADKIDLVYGRQAEDDEDDDERRERYFEHRDELIEFVTARRGPYARPAAFWQYEAPALAHPADLTGDWIAAAERLEQRRRLYLLGGLR